MARASRRGSLASARSLILLQAVCGVVLGGAMLMSPTIGFAGLIAWFGLYWLWRTIGTVSHTLFVDPDRWAGRGLIAVLNLAAALVALQAPLLELFSVGPAIVLFVGFQSAVAGGLELVLAERGNNHAVGFLGLINVGLGTTLVIAVIAGVQILVPLVGWAVLVAGLLAAYVVFELPSPRRHPHRWRLGP